MRRGQGKKPLAPMRRLRGEVQAVGGQVSADEVTLVILFFLTCGVLISFITDSMLQAIAEKRAQLFGNEDSWEGYVHYGPGPRRR